MKKIPIRNIVFALLTLLTLNGCSNFFLIKPRNNPGGPVTDIPQGFGSITVNLSQGEARTLIPELVLDNVYLEYLFYNEDTATVLDEEIPDEEGKFILEPGTYTLEVQAFVDSERTRLAARGDANFTVTAGVAGSANLILSPALSGGTGSLAFSLEYPAGATLETFTLTLIGGPSINLKTGGNEDGTDPLTFSGVKTDIAAGYYLLQALLKNTGGEYAGKTEVVHIYQNMDVEANYAFSAANFSASLINTTNDAGPGSLREAIAGANAGQAIRVALPAGAVIQLESPLVISKNLSLNGSGVTLTRAPSWTSSGTDTQLLRITGTGTVVTIRGVHFKNGLATNNGGAVYNTGTLTLEACIFSGNQVTGSSGFPGAVYSTGDLTVRACTFYGNTSAYRAGALRFSGSGKTLTLTGNLFYGNTAPNYPVVYMGSGSISASYNVVDAAAGAANCGWETTAGTGNVYSVTGLPVSGKSFRLLSGSPAAGTLTALPDPYPAADFYGDSINVNGAAGAVQAATGNTTGYSYLDLSVNNNAWGSVGVSSVPDADGLVPNGAVTLTATVADTSYFFSHWLPDGGSAVKTNPYPLNISDHTRIRAVFGVAVNSVNDGADSAATPGTLRYALTNIQDGDVISVNLTGETIELESALPTITKSITIEGNGVTLTRAASWTSSYDSQFLRITGATVKISRVHFKDGLAISTAGAVYSTGTLTLDSCIFSGNKATDGGYGAVYSSGTLTVRACTFYGNYGYNYGVGQFGAGTLTGNLFYGNTFVYNGFPVGTSSAVTSYNVLDAPFGTTTGSGQSGWAAPGTGDLYSADMSVSGKSFKLLSGSPAAAKLPNPLPEDYPEKDFYGQTISAGGAAGAVQAATANGSGYSYLDIHSPWGSVEASPAPDEDGLYSNGTPINLTLSPSGTLYSLAYWLMADGTRVRANPYNLTLSANTRIQAVFGLAVDNGGDAATGNGTAGTLRYALNSVKRGGIINVSVAEIALVRALPDINNNAFTIEGNGVILTKASSWTNTSDGQLLRFTNGANAANTLVATIRGVHFKNGKSGAQGGAIYNNGGTLTLESCIFSGNQQTTASAAANYRGGAVYNRDGTLTIRGCTFYRNTGGTSGGAIALFGSGTLTLTGNLFYGNTVTGTGGYPVVINNNNTFTVSASHNVADAPFGTTDTDCGWAQGTGDTTFDDLSITGDPIADPVTFAPVSDLQSPGVLPGAAPADFPLTDFYGSTRTFPGAPGAVATAP
jgi:hypothetical protein